MSAESAPAQAGSGGAMSDRLKALGAKLGEMSMGSRIVASLLVALLVGGGILAVTQLTKPSMSPLFTGLSSADAAAVVEQLSAAGVEYQLTDGGTSILVPDEQVYDQRLVAAGAGLPSTGGTGYSLLDEVGITSSEFQQDTSYKRAIEGELAATISEMDGVAQASVKLATPQETVFAAEQDEPTASVFVSTRPGTELSNQQVQAIVHLASASVEGMDATNVAVVDSTGKVLSAVGEGPLDTAGGADERSTAIQASVQKVLDNLVGPGNSTVAATVETVRASSETKSEEFTTPEGGVQALTEQTSTEDYTGTGAPGGTGVLGPDNVANTGADGNGAGEYTSDSETRTNAVNKTTTSTTSPGGEVARQTVAVAVDAAAANGVTPAQVTALVNGAAGIDPARGDAVTVEILPFSTAGAEEAAAALEAQAAAEAQAAKDKLTRDIITMSIAGAVVIAGLALWFITRRKRRVEELEDLGETAPAPMMLDRTDTGQIPVVPAVEQPATTALPELPTIPMVEDTERTPTSVERVRDAARSDPQRAAATMRSMMEGPTR